MSESNETIQYIVSADEAGSRLDQFLVKKVPDIPFYKNK